MSEDEELVTLHLLDCPLCVYLVCWLVAQIGR